MGLKKSQSHNYAKLSSEDALVVLLDAELRGACILAGLLCLYGYYRYTIDSNTTIDLFDGANFIAKVQLPVEYTGDKNGYLPNVTLKILSGFKDSQD
jgi:hypothetical protein